jgi:hypothetical protein
MEFNSDGELFLPDHDADLVHRYTFDSSGNPTQNGSISVDGAVGVTFSPEGELFVGSHFVGGIHRFLFDASGNAIPNGFVATNSLTSVGFVAVPEPSTALLVALGGLALMRRR